MANSPFETTNRRQKYLGTKGLILLLAFLGTFIPISTDLYLPALPGMTESLQVSIQLLNLTLISFFVFYSLAMLVWGPMSDKFGRKPILLIGIVLYVIASLLCSQSANVYQLIAFRILQAIGGGAATAVETAIIKDVYGGARRETILAIVQTMIIIAPVIAPILGAFLLSFTSWRGVFLVLAGFGLVGMIGALLFEETLDTRSTGNIAQVLSRLGVVLKNPGFSTLLFTFSLGSMGLLSFVASSSYIYVKGFGLSEQAYSFYFAMNGLAAIVGPFTYIRLSKRFRRKPIISTCFAVILLSGIMICTLGQTAPYWFALSVIPASFAGSLIRPPSTNLMLEQQQFDTGSASSLIGCSSIFMGSVGMLVISMDWANRILALGILYLLVGATCSLAWSIVSTKPFVKQIQPVAETR